MVKKKRVLDNSRSQPPNVPKRKYTKRASAQIEPPALTGTRLRSQSAGTPLTGSARVATRLSGKDSSTAKRGEGNKQKDVPKTSVPGSDCFNKASKDEKSETKTQQAEVLTDKPANGSRGKTLNKNLLVNGEMSSYNIHKFTQNSLTNRNYGRLNPRARPKKQRKYGRNSINTPDAKKIVPAKKTPVAVRGRTPIGRRKSTEKPKSTEKQKPSTKRISKDKSKAANKLKKDLSDTSNEPSMPSPSPVEHASLVASSFPLVRITNLSSNEMKDHLFELSNNVNQCSNEENDSCVTSAVEQPNDSQPSALEQPEDDSQPSAVEQPEDDSQPSAVEQPNYSRPSALEQPDDDSQLSAVEQPPDDSQTSAVEQPEDDSQPSAVEQPDTPDFEDMVTNEVLRSPQSNMAEDTSQNLCGISNSGSLEPLDSTQSTVPLNGEMGKEISAEVVPDSTCIQNQEFDTGRLLDVTEPGWW